MDGHFHLIRHTPYILFYYIPAQVCLTRFLWDFLSCLSLTGHFIFTLEAVPPYVVHIFLLALSTPVVCYF